MRRIHGILPLVLLLCLLAGCKKKSEPQDLQPRLQAAMQITSVNDRDKALKSVAFDAAGLGSGDVVKHAVGGILSTDLRDETASDCAIELAKGRQVSAAKDVAQMITATSLRDSTLKKLAEGAQ